MTHLKNTAAKSEAILIYCGQQQWGKVRWFTTAYKIVYELLEPLWWRNCFRSNNLSFFILSTRQAGFICCTRCSGVFFFGVDVKESTRHSTRCKRSQCFMQIRWRNARTKCLFATFFPAFKCTLKQRHKISCVRRTCRRFARTLIAQVLGREKLSLQYCATQTLNAR